MGGMRKKRKGRGRREEKRKENKKWETKEGGS